MTVYPKYEELETLLDTVNQASNTYYIRFNITKTKYMVIEKVNYSIENNNWKGKKRLIVVNKWAAY